MVCSSYKKGSGHSFALHPSQILFLNNLLRDVICSTARFRLCVHTLRFETATWNQSKSPTCDLCDADNIKDEQHVHFHCANPNVISLRRKYASLFSPSAAHDVPTFLSQNNNKLDFFLHELIVFLSRLAAAFPDGRPFSVKPCKTWLGAPLGWEHL